MPSRRPIKITLCFRPKGELCRIPAALLLGFGATWLGVTSIGHARDLYWIDDNSTWVDGVGANKWTPADEPDSDDTAIFNNPNSVLLGSGNSVQSLLMLNGTNLSTEGYDLTVGGVVYLDDPGSRLTIAGEGSILRAYEIGVKDGATLSLAGGTAIVDKVGGVGYLLVTPGATVSGAGTVTFADSPSVATVLLTNNGTISASSKGASPFSTPPTGVLQITAVGTGARIDLDGENEAGNVNVTRNQTLDINGKLSDAFSGTMNLYQNAAIDISAPWALSLGAINIDNGLIDNTFPLPDVPAGVSYIRGGTFTVSSGSINVLDGDGVLQFDAPLVMNGGLLSNRGHVIFNNNATITRSASLQMAQSGADLTVNAGSTVSIDQSTFDMDGLSAGLTTIVVQSGGSLVLNADDYDPGSQVNAFDSVVSLHGGRMTMTSADSEFVMNGIINMQSSAGQISEWGGQPIDIGNDSTTGRAKLYVSGSGGGVSRFSAQVNFNADADVNVTSGSHLVFANTVNLDTVNGGAHAQFTGSGQMSFDGSVNVNEATTFSMAGGVIDLDGSDTVGEPVSVNAPLIINAATLKSFGRVNLGGGVNTLTIDGKNHGGSMSVTLDNPHDSWTLNQLGAMELLAPSGSPTTLLDGADVNLHGLVTVTGSVGIRSAATIGGVVDLISAGSSNGLVLQGGNLNRLAGGMINGPGVFRAEPFTSLQGFGFLTADIDFSATSDLLADNGVLTLNGDLLNVGTLGTVDADGVLNSPHSWNTSAAHFVVLRGGQIKGASMTVGNPSGVFGHGLITARVVNDQRVTATTGTLIMHADAYDNDWDGTTGAGVLAAQGHTLELIDTFAFPFTGKVDADAGRVFANGFALGFEPGSSLRLSNGGVYESTDATTLSGSIQVLGGVASTIQIDGEHSLTFAAGSSTSLDGDLQLMSSESRIASGAVFSGTGALVVFEGGELRVDANADVDVLVNNQGKFVASGSFSVGRVGLGDFEQTSTGGLAVDIFGTGLNQYDRLVVDGAAVIGGRLEVNFDGVTPALGSTFDILTTTAGVTGAFEVVDYLSLPAGKTFALSYLPHAVRLSVVSMPDFAADFDHDGDVDQTDYLIWRSAYGQSNLGDANGDGLTDAADYTVWRDTLGSSPMAPISASAVPEPSSIIYPLLAALAAGLGGRKPRSPIRSRACDTTREPPHPQ